MKGLLFTFGLTYGGALVSLFSPYYGLLIYVCFAMIRPESLWHWSVPTGGNYSRIVAMALLVGWALKGFGNWRFRRAMPIVAALLAYFGWQIVCAVAANNQAVAWGQIEQQAKIVLPFIVGATLIDTVGKLKALTWVIVLSQGYIALEANRGYLAGYNWLRETGFGGMDNNSVCIAMVTTAGTAFFLGISEKPLWRKWLAFAIAGLSAHCAMFGGSRGAMLALIVTGFGSFILIPKSPRHYVFLLLAIMIGLRLAGPEVRQRFHTSFAAADERDTAAQSRIDLWADCWAVMKQNPVLGVGPDHWPLIAVQFGWPRGKECHSVWFNAGAELGFIGLFLLAAFYGLAIVRCWRLMRHNPGGDPWHCHSARMIVASLVGFCVAASFVSLDNLEPPYYIVLLGVGALKLSRPQQQISRRIVTRPQPVASQLIYETRLA